jgi:hypothetical protein
VINKHAYLIARCSQHEDAGVRIEGMSRRNALLVQVHDGQEATMPMNGPCKSSFKTSEANHFRETDHLNDEGEFHGTLHPTHVKAEKLLDIG